MRTWAGTLFAIATIVTPGMAQSLPGSASNTAFDYYAETALAQPATVADESSPSDRSAPPKPMTTADDAPMPAVEGDDAAAAPPENKCDEKKLKELDKKAATAYKGMFYDNDFSYLCDDCYDGCLLGENWKRRCFGECGTYDLGGQYRARLHNERNFRGAGLTGNDDDYLLHRVRLYGNFEFNDYARVFVEYLDAESNYENFAPRIIEVDRSDLLNAFGDLKVYDDCCRQLWLRAGRQELLYGAQRCVSPLDFANTRRTFEGYKFMLEGDCWNVDGWWTRPVVPNAVQFDSVDQTREFMGLYAQRKDLKNEKADFYFLRFNDVAGPLTFDFNTFGARWEGSCGDWLWDHEAAYQYGTVNAANHDSGMYTLGFGRKFDCHCWKPTLFAYYDWAEGDAPVNNAFNDNFPLGHKYMGFMDLYARRNIEDLNFLLTAKPCEHVSLLLWYHILHLQDAANDVPYNVNQTPFVVTPGGSSSLGQELDLLVKWDITARMNLTFGYSHFFVGDWYRTNPSPPPFVGDADFYMTEFTVNF